MKNQIGTKNRQGYVVILDEATSSKKAFLEKLISDLRNSDLTENQISDLGLDENEVTICNCSNRVALVHSLNVNGRLQGEGQQASGGRPYGDNISSDINWIQTLSNTESLTASNYKREKSCDAEDLNFKNAVKVGIIDSGIRLLYNCPSNVSVVQHNCSNSYFSSIHGEVVAMRLYEKLEYHNFFERNKLEIHSYNVFSRYSNDSEIISLFDVICALIRAVDDECSFINLSLGFNIKIPLLDKVLYECFYKGAKAITCSAGNDNINSENAFGSNYPSNLMRKSLHPVVRENLYEVIGITSITQEINPTFSETSHLLWTGSRDGSNFSTRRDSLSYGARADIDINGERFGGTSFASPRILADLICGKDLKSETRSAEIGPYASILNFGLQSILSPGRLSFERPKIYYYPEA